MQTNFNFLKTRENQSKAKLGTGNFPFLMCTNIQSLRCHQDELIFELGNNKNKPAIITVTETWSTDYNVFEDDYNLEKYQPTESKPRISGKDCGGIVFYNPEGIEYKVIKFQSGMECLFIRAHFGRNGIRSFCVIYRPHSQKILNFLQGFENLLEFLRR